MWFLAPCFFNLKIIVNVLSYVRLCIILFGTFVMAIVLPYCWSSQAVLTVVAGNEPNPPEKEDAALALKPIWKQFARILNKIDTNSLNKQVTFPQTYKVCVGKITNLFKVTSVPVNFLQRFKADSNRSGSSFKNLSSTANLSMSLVSKVFTLS